MSCKNTKLISEDEMRALIEEAKEEAGGLMKLCQKLHLKSPAPLSLALRKKRPVGDDIAIRFKHVSVRMYQRI